jgi:MFS family permease
MRRRVHYAWVVLGVLVVTLIAAGGLRSTFGVFIKPIEAEFGWSRTSLSIAAALSLLVFGAVAPLAGRMADLWGARVVFTASLGLLGIGALASAFVTQLWHVYIASGVLMAVGAGGGTLTSAVPLIARWFDKHRGLVMGIAGAAMSAGQLVMIPLATWLTLTLGWRQSYIWLGLGLVVLILPLGAALLRNDPRDKGLEPYGAAPTASMPHGSFLPSDGRVSITEAAQVPAFWLLVGSYFICGYTSSGLVGTHLIPHAVEHGFSEMAAAQALGVMGATSILGAIASGWICDRFGRKGPLAWYYLFRGLSLLFLLVVWDVPSLHLFAAILGLNWFSTVPPTTTLTANIFGRHSVGELSGWIFLAHQVGAALAASLGGWIHDLTGSYAWAFISAALLAFVAAGLTLGIREEPVTSQPGPAAGIPVPTDDGALGTPLRRSW